MTGLQLAALSGALLTLGLVLLVGRLVPAEPDLADAVNRLSPGRARAADHTLPVSDRTGRIGLWAMRVLPAGVWLRTPTRELALLRIPLTRFYGEKVTMAAAGLVLPPLLTTFFQAIGLPLPLVVPVAASVVLAVVLWFMPDLNAVSDAKRARAEFARALAAYVDLVALERNAGSGARQAMESAAQVGDSWVFQRLGEELARSRWSGEAPWDALHQLSAELGLPGLDDLADIMRLSGEEGAQVYATLRARAAAMRTALVTDDQARANATSEQMTVPAMAIGAVFVAMLIAPPLLRMTGLA